MNQEIQPRISKAMTAGMKKGGAIKGFVPESFEDIQRCATLAVNAGHFHVMKKAANGWDTNEIDETKSIANATLAIMQGMECGMPVVMAIQLIAVINGRCVIWGEAIPALIWKNGHTIREWIDGEGDARVAWCEITRCDNGEIIQRKFSVEDAKRAGLWQENEKVEKTSKKDGSAYEVENKSPWYRFQERMLQMRARGFCARDGVPDVMNGIYVREEVEDDDDVRLGLGQAPREVAPVEIPTFETKPAAQEQKSLPAPSEEEVSLPAFETHNTREAVEERVLKISEKALTAAVEAEKLNATPSAAKKVAKAAKKGRRSAQEKAPPPVEAKEPEPAPAPQVEEMTQEEKENITRLIILKFGAAESVDDLNDVFDAENETVSGLPMKLRTQVTNAYDERYSALDG